MHLVVDDKALEADKLGLKTVGEVLSHLQRENRLVVHVLIDGKEPDLAGLPAIRASMLKNHTVYIETADPRKMANEVLDEVSQQLEEADRLRADAVALLQCNSHTQAMQKLSGCFTTWSHAEESIRKVAQLLRIDLSRIMIDGKPFTDVLASFVDQFRNIRSALEDRDFVALSDTLAYEATQTTRQWKDAVAAMRGMIA